MSQDNQPQTTLITVIGKWINVKDYFGLPGYNVFPKIVRWTRERNRKWLDDALARGDLFLIASSDYTGEFLNELEYLLQRITEHKDDRPEQ